MPIRMTRTCWDLMRAEYRRDYKLVEVHDEPDSPGGAWVEVELVPKVKP